MIENEIRKALEHCRDNNRNETCEHCLSCPASDWELEEVSKGCIDDLLDKAINLIDTLTAENERLEKLCEAKDKYVEHLRTQFKRFNRTYEYVKKKARNEAINEFAERLKEKNRSVGILRQGDIDNLLKEMVGEGK